MLLDRLSRLSLPSEVTIYRTGEALVSCPAGYFKTIICGPAQSAQAN